jgi:hypothetical protein
MQTFGRLVNLIGQRLKPYGGIDKITKYQLGCVGLAVDKQSALKNRKSQWRRGFQGNFGGLNLQDLR